MPNVESQKSKKLKTQKSKIRTRLARALLLYILYLLSIIFCRSSKYRIFASCRMETGGWGLEVRDRRLMSEDRRHSTLDIRH